MPYFIISNSQGETTIQKFVDKEDLLREIQTNYGNNGFFKKHTFLTEPMEEELVYHIIPSYPGNEEILILKGEIVTPKSKDVIKTFDVD